MPAMFNDLNQNLQCFAFLNNIKENYVAVTNNGFKTGRISTINFY